MDSLTFEDLVIHFSSKLSDMTETVAMQACMEDADEDGYIELSQPLDHLWQELDQLTTVLTLIRNKCSEKECMLKQIKVKKKMLLNLKKKKKKKTPNTKGRLILLLSKMNFNKN